jgi:hypothetical protein
MPATAQGLRSIKSGEITIKTHQEPVIAGQKYSRLRRSRLKMALASPDCGDNSANQARERRRYFTLHLRLNAELVNYSKFLRRFESYGRGECHAIHREVVDSPRV